MSNSNIGTASATFIDGPNIDCVLGKCVLGRQPSSIERPRWDRVLQTCRAWFGASRVRFVLNPVHFAEQTDQVSPFYRFLVTTGYEVPPANSFGAYPPNADPVDEFIKHGILASLAESTSGSAVGIVLFTHDHGYAPVLTTVLEAGGRVWLVGFREWFHPVLVQLESRGATILDLEYDLEAFNVKLPRPFQPRRKCG